MELRELVSDFLTLLPAQTEATVRLKHLLELRGFGLLTGEPGSGKTTQCAALPRRCTQACIE